MRTVGIIGGGLTGLTVARGCLQVGHNVVLIESSERLGGQIHTERVALADGELVIEHGAEGFVASSQAAEQLAVELGLGEHLVLQQTNLSFAFDGKEITELAPGEAARLLGFQVAKEELGRGVRSLLRGTGELTDALVAAIGSRATLCLGVKPLAVTRHGSGLRVLLPEGRAFDVDAVVVATSAYAAGALMQPLVGDAALRLRDAPTLSSVNVALAYRTASLPPLRGSGFIAVGAAAAGGLRACSYASLKLPGRATSGYTLLRPFFRPEEADLATLLDADWIARAVTAVRAALGVTSDPVVTRVARWSNALPVHRPTHRDVVLEVEAALSGQEIYLAGSAFHGAGIDAALRSARTVLARVAG